MVLNKSDGEIGDRIPFFKPMPEWPAVKTV